MEESSRITILLVDDDEEVRSTMARVLREGGYQVVEANDAATALGVIARGTQVELLVTDVVMPGLSGFDLASQVTAVSKVPVLLVSTFALPQDAIAGPALQKPFTPSVLLDTVRGLVALPDPAWSTVSSTQIRADQVSVLLSADPWLKHRKSGASARQVWYITGTGGGVVRWRIADLLKERQWSTYRLVQESRLAHTLVYRIAKAGRQVKRVHGHTLDALCHTFGVPPGELFEFVPCR